MGTDRSVSFHVPRYVLWLFGLLIVAPWLVFGLWVVRSRSSQVASPPPPPAGESHASASSRPRNPTPEVAHSKPGPWGDLEYFRILLEPPEEFILSDYTNMQIQPWVFKGYTDEQLAQLWKAAGLDEAQLKFVSEPSHRERQSDRIILHPTADFITSLSADARGQIYVALGEYPENLAQYSPYRLRSSAAGDWLEDADIPPEAVAFTKRLFYQRGTATCFSDATIVLPTIPDPGQRVRYIKALARKSGLVVQLHIAPGQDVTPLVQYWGRGGRSKDLKPLLQSIARRSSGGAIDIVHLVPRFPRLLAYTYPLPSDRPLDASHDCHWSSFNFQNDEPDERFSNIDYVRQVLLEQYYPVMGEPLLGDIVIFVRKDGVVVHSCVYIADDIVFTKNGPAFSIPWLFASLADVQAFYAATPGVEMRRYRAKNL